MILFISILCGLVSTADDTPTEAEVRPARLAIIAIGPKPARRFSNTGSTILAPKEGEVPPRRLYFEIAQEEGREKILNSINVTFNNPSHFINVPANKSLRLLVRKKNEYIKYINTKPLAERSTTIIILRPEGVGDRRWLKEPLKYEINLISEPFKNKKVAILNLSRRAIKSVFHEDRQVLEAGGFQTYESIKELGLHRIAAAYGKENKVIYNTAMRLNKNNQLIIFVLYDANPNTNDGRTVGVLRFSVDIEQPSS